MAASTANLVIPVLLVFSCILSVYSFTDDEFEMASDSVLTVEHTFDDGNDPVFTKRGTIIIHSIKSGQAEFTQDKSLNDEDRENLKKLAEKDGVYRIRINSKQTSGSPIYVSSFMKACALYESKLNDIITVHLDLSANIIGVSATSTSAYCLGLEVDEEELLNFNTTVDVMQTVQGPTPETQSYVEKVERERADKVQGNQTDNRSFFGKYWMYIIPVVVIMMFANSADPGAAGGGGR